MAISFKDRDGLTPISDKQFSRLKCKGEYRFSDEEYNVFEKIVCDAGLDYIAVKQSEIAGVIYDFIYDMEEEILYNLKDGVALVAEAVEDDADETFAKLLARLNIK